MVADVFAAVAVVVAAAFVAEDGSAAAVDVCFSTLISDKLGGLA